MRLGSENKKDWKNLWYYYKWYVLCGVVLLAIIGNIAGNALGLWTKAPDFQIAYIGKSELPPSAISSLEQGFAAIASDFNGDGEIIVQINQYINYAADTGASYYGYTSEIPLIGDISNCESYFFLMDDPERFQLEFQALASPDGSCPDHNDYSIEGKVTAWTDCPALSAMMSDTRPSAGSDAGQPSINQELFSGLYFGRRCFYNGTTAENADKCSELWDFIITSDKIR